MMRGAAAFLVVMCLGSPGAGAALGSPAEEEPVKPLPPARALAVVSVHAEPGLGVPGHLGAAGTQESPFRLPGDSDSVLTLGGRSPSGKLSLRAAVEVNDVVLKAIPPDPAVAPTDARPRASGSWSPLDAWGRPYQLRLGARLVW